MQALVVTIQIKPGCRDAFVEALLDDAKGSVGDEPGCLRFDVIQDSEDPDRIHLYEIYRDEAAMEAHRNAPHYLKWRDAVKDWFASEPVRRQGTTVFPPESAWHK